MSTTNEKNIDIYEDKKANCFEGYESFCDGDDESNLDEQSNLDKDLKNISQKFDDEEEDNLDKDLKNISQKFDDVKKANLTPTRKKRAIFPQPSMALKDGLLNEDMQDQLKKRKIDKREEEEQKLREIAEKKIVDKERIAEMKENVNSMEHDKYQLKKAEIADFIKRRNINLN